MEPFLNRVKEQRRIRKALESDKTTFLIVYGRRRIGKSSLLRHLVGETDTYYLADQNEKSLQIAALATELAKIIPGFNQATYPTWESIFISLENTLKERITLYLDEFPYLVKSSPELPSIIQKMIDLQKHTLFNIVLCGSSQQMMKELYEGTTAPLYGRAEEIIKLGPMEIGWLQQYLGSDSLETIKEYAVWGGVPRYWELRKKYKNWKEAIFELILNKDSILYDEPLRLFLDDMRSAVQAYSIVTLVGQGNQRLSEIAAKLEKPATHLARPLAQLVSLGYLKREIPFGENEKNPKKSLYRINDPFLNFYFTFVTPNKSAIEFEQTAWLQQQLDIKLPYYISESWEDLVRTSVPLVRYFDTDWGKAHRYWGKPDKKTEMEIDVVAESADRKSLLVGEVKWADKANVAELLQELRAKIAKTGWDKQYKIYTAVWLKDKKRAGLDQVDVFDASDVVLPVN